MSWTTTSVTVMVTPARAEAALRRLRDARHPALVCEELAPGGDYLLVRSRHDGLERNLRACLAAFAAPGVAYFHALDSVAHSMPWGVVLDGPEIARASDGLATVLAALRTDATLWGDLGGSRAMRGFDASIFIESWPRTVAAANAWAVERIAETEGEGFYCVPVFLHAHRLMLERARAVGLGIVYAVDAV